MSNSIVFYHDHGDVMHIIDPDALPHHDTIHPLLDIAVAVINAGYAGVRIDECRLSNGRYMQCLNVNHATPEGRILDAIGTEFASSGDWPLPDAVVDLIRKYYISKGLTP
jgi:hypothetical protein